MNEPTELKYLKGTYLGYVNNTGVRAEGKNAPDKICYRDEAGKEIEVSVWGPTKGVPPVKPASLKNVAPGMAIEIPARKSSSNKGIFYWNMAIEHDIKTLPTDPNQKALPAAAEETTADWYRKQAERWTTDDYWEAKFAHDIENSVKIGRQSNWNTAVAIHAIGAKDALDITTTELYESVLKMAHAIEKDVTR